ALEQHRPAIEPKARHPDLADQPHGLVWTADHHHHIGRRVGRIEHGPVQHDGGAGEAGVDLHLGLGQGGGDAHFVRARGRLRGRRLEGGRRGRQDRDHCPPPGASTNISSGRMNRPRPIWIPTSSTIRPMRARISSARKRPEARAPYWAPITPPNSSSEASTMSTVWLRPACSTVVIAVVMMIWNRLVPTTTEAFIRRM